MFSDLNKYRAVIGLYNNRLCRIICHGIHKRKTDSKIVSLVISFILIVLLTGIDLSLSMSLVMVLCHSQSINCSITYNLMLDLPLLCNIYFFIKMLMMSSDVHKNPSPDGRSKLSIIH